MKHDMYKLFIYLLFFRAVIFSANITSRKTFPTFNSSVYKHDKTRSKRQNYMRIDRATKYMQLQLCMYILYKTVVLYQRKPILSCNHCPQRVDTQNLAAHLHKLPKFDLFFYLFAVRCLRNANTQDNSYTTGSHGSTNKYPNTKISRSL